MAIETTYEEVSRMIRMKFSGTLTFEDYVNYTETLTNSDTIGQVDGAIHDMLDIEKIEVNIAGASAIGDLAKRLPPHLQPKFEAVVSTDSVHIGLASVYSIPLKGSREFKIFRTMEEAETWLADCLSDSLAPV